MNVSVTGHHIDVTPALRDYASSKLSKLEKHFDHVTDIHVVLSVEKLRQRAARIVAQIAGVSDGRAHDCLNDAAGDVKTATLLAAGAVALVLALVVGYLVKVVAPRYPRR